MKKKSLLVLLVLVLAVSLVAVGCGGNNQPAAPSGGDAKPALDFPTKDINMIIAFSAGGSSDVQARIVEKYFKDEFGVNLIFQYKTGAGGAVGFGELAKSRPDGYTIGGLNVPHIVLQPLAQPTQFDIDSFEYIAQVVNDPQVLAVQTNSPITDLQDLIARAKDNPGRLTMGNVGTLSGHHIASLEFMDLTDTNFTLIPYTGAADQIAALLGGHVDVIMGNLNDVMRDQENIRVIAIAEPERHVMAPDWPTFKEQGVDLVSGITRLFAVPAGTPQEIVDRLREGFRNIATNPEYLADMERIGQPAEYLDGPEVELRVKEASERAKELLEKHGLLKK